MLRRSWAHVRRNDTYVRQKRTCFAAAAKILALSVLLEAGSSSKLYERNKSGRKDDLIKARAENTVVFGFRTRLFGRLRGQLKTYAIDRRRYARGRFAGDS